MCLNDVGTRGDKREWKHRTVLLWTSAMENSSQVSVYQEFLILCSHIRTSLDIMVMVEGRKFTSGIFVETES